MGILLDWVKANCKFAQMDVKVMADEAWDLFSREEQYQIDRQMIHQKPRDAWLDQDKNALMAAEQSGDVAALQQLIAKYKQLDVAGKPSAGRGNAPQM